MMLPPTVPRFLICGDPIVEAAAARSGADERRMSDLMSSACVVSGRTTIIPFFSSIPLKESRQEISTTVSAPGSP
jgi:hypothetical protein